MSETRSDMSKLKYDTNISVNIQLISHIKAQF